MNTPDATAPRAYLQRLGLERSPFPTTPDAENYFSTGPIEGELAEAVHCVLARKGFVLLTGDVGTGKSTFLRRLLDEVEDRGAIVSLLFNTFLQGPDLLAAICRDFGVKAGTDAAANLDALNRFLLRCWHDGRTCVLVIDDAQNLDVASLELLRLLSNLESGQEKLLQIVLAGQTELVATLAGHGIRQLASRIVKHIRMHPLDAGDCARYVEFRLAGAGAAGRIRVEPQAHALLHRLSAGNPRRVHLVMDRCLYGLVAQDSSRVDAGLVRAAAAETGFLPARLRHRHWPLAAAALVVATGLATAATFAWRSDPQPVATAEAPIATMHVPAESPWQACTQQLAGDGPLQLLQVPARHHDTIAGRSDLCLQRAGSGWMVAWHPPFDAGDVRRLQLYLLARDGSVGAIDGRFGPRTRAALARFQVDHGIDPAAGSDALTLLLLTTKTTGTRDGHG